MVPLVSSKSSMASSEIHFKLACVHGKMILNYILGFFQQAMRVIQIVQRIGLREHQNQKPWKPRIHQGNVTFGDQDPKGCYYLQAPMVLPEPQPLLRPAIERPPLI